MSTRLRAELEKHIQLWLNDNCDQDDWPDVIVPTSTNVRMADAAYAVFAVIGDAQDYVETKTQPEQFDPVYIEAARALIAIAGEDSRTMTTRERIKRITDGEPAKEVLWLCRLALAQEEVLRELKNVGPEKN